MPAKILSAERWAMLERWASRTWHHKSLGLHRGVGMTQGITITEPVETEGVVFLPCEYLQGSDAHDPHPRE